MKKLVIITVYILGNTTHLCAMEEPIAITYKSAGQTAGGEFAPLQSAPAATATSDSTEPEEVNPFATTTQPRPEPAATSIKAHPAWPTVWFNTLAETPASRMPTNRDDYESLLGRVELNQDQTISDKAIYPLVDAAFHTSLTKEQLTDLFAPLSGRIQSLTDETQHPSGQFTAFAHSIASTTNSDIDQVTAIKRLEKATVKAMRTDYLAKSNFFQKLFHLNSSGKTFAGMGASSIALGTSIFFFYKAHKKLKEITLQREALRHQMLEAFGFASSKKLAGLLGSKTAHLDADDQALITKYLALNCQFIKATNQWRRSLAVIISSGGIALALLMHHRKQTPLKGFVRKKAAKPEGAPQPKRNGGEVNPFNP